jgi:hypothetical protein
MKLQHRFLGHQEIGYAYTIVLSYHAICKFLTTANEYLFVSLFLPHNISRLE